MKQTRTPFVLITLLLASASMSGCNLFGGIDSPSGDAQLLSAARACFDDGDYECALNYYKEVSNSESDTRNMEEAFVALEKNGCGMKDFFKAFSKGNIGSALTTLANTLAPSANATKRKAFFAAYRKIDSITDVNIRGFTRFVTATILAAEVLAEKTGSDYTLQKTDICTTKDNPCTTTVLARTGTTAIDAVSESAFDSTNGYGTNADLYIIQQSLMAVNTALSGEMGVTGKFNTGALSVVSQLSSLATASTVAGLLVANGIGADQ